MSVDTKDILVINGNQPRTSKPLVKRVVDEPKAIGEVIDIGPTEVVHINDKRLYANVWGKEISFGVEETIPAFLEKESPRQTLWDRITRNISTGDSYTIPVAALEGNRDTDVALSEVFAGVSRGLGGNLDLANPTHVITTQPTVTYYYATDLTSEAENLPIVRGREHKGKVVLCRVVKANPRGGPPTHYGFEPFCDDQLRMVKGNPPNFPLETQKNIKKAFGL